MLGLSDELLLENMKKAARKVPELSFKYEQAIAQNLILKQKPDQAIKLAQKSINRVKKAIPFHSHFSQNTLLIDLLWTVQGKVQATLKFEVSKLTRASRNISQKGSKK